MLEKVENLEEYWYSEDYGDKEFFEIDKKLFKQIFGHTLETLAIKLINTKNKEEN